MNRSGLLIFIAAVGCVGGEVAAPSRAVQAAVERPLPPRRNSGPTSPPSTTPGPTPPPGAWRTVTRRPSFYASLPILLTDGTVMVHDAGTANWWRLTPDAMGSYENGTWSQLPSMPDGYAPLYFASAVLPDGRVIIEGGEYQDFEAVWSTRGAIFDPVANTWTAVAPPAGWSTIGDAPSAVLADGRFMLGNCCTDEAAVLNARTLTWTPIGTGKVGRNNEEGWTLLPDGDLLTVSVNNPADPMATERFNPRTQRWSSAGSTMTPLVWEYELGPQMLRPDGTVFAVGATGHTSIYSTRTRRWTPGPDLPVLPGEGQLRVTDGPAVLTPAGNVLFVASHGLYETPTHFFEFNGTSLTAISDPPAAAYDSSYYVNLLLLPSGEVLHTDFADDIALYLPTGRARRDIAPEIESGERLRQLRAGATYTFTGERLHGISQGVAYGDEGQSPTNYPLVRITNLATRHVTYARTHDFSNMSIARDAESRASFDVPAGIEAGASTLEVVVNGIPSEALRVNVAR